MQRNPTLRRRRNGAVLLYVTVCLAMLMGLCSFAVDYGRAQLIKTQLRRTADSAARSAALGILTNTSYADAKDIAARCLADGSPVVLQTGDIELGHWDTTARQFTPNALPLNAARVTAVRSAARGTSVPLPFAAALGFGHMDLKAKAVAMLVPPVNVNDTVQATANPFLAGMPAGTVASLNNPHNSPDYAGDPNGTVAQQRQSPIPVGMPLTPGQFLTFDSITGTAGHDPHLSSYQPDGQLDDISHNTNNDENHIADMGTPGVYRTGCPINALVGVFLNDNMPTDNPTPTSLDFSTDASRDFNALHPQVQQIFFIGDGLDSTGHHQQFYVPQGATRLFLATWDFFEWNNNYGWRTVKINRPAQVITVQ